MNKYDYKGACSYSSQESKEEEKVNHPSHYNHGGKETIEILKDFLKPLGILINLRNRFKGL